MRPTRKHQKHHRGDSGVDIGDDSGDDNSGGGSRDRTKSPKTAKLVHHDKNTTTKLAKTKEEVNINARLMP